MRGSACTAPTRGCASIASPATSRPSLRHASSPASSGPPPATPGAETRRAAQEPPSSLHVQLISTRVCQVGWWCSTRRSSRSERWSSQRRQPGPQARSRSQPSRRCSPERLDVHLGVVRERLELGAGAPPRRVTARRASHLGCDCDQIRVDLQHPVSFEGSVAEARTGRTPDEMGTRRKASARFEVAGSVVAARLPEGCLDGRCQVLERSGSYL